MSEPIEIETGVDGIVVRLRPVERRGFHWFIDCNMSSAWVGDQFRLFSGKYGEDPLWGDADELGYATGATVAEAFATPREAFTRPQLPPNTPPGTPGRARRRLVRDDPPGPVGPERPDALRPVPQRELPGDAPVRPGHGRGLRRGGVAPGPGRRRDAPGRAAHRHHALHRWRRVAGRTAASCSRTATSG